MRRADGMGHKACRPVAAMQRAVLYSILLLTGWMPAVFCAPAVAADKILEGVALPRYLQTPSGLLERTVCGVRDSLWIEHYVAAVYVPRGGSLDAVRDAQQAKAVTLHVIEDRYLPDEIPEKWRPALERSLPKAAMGRVRAAYRGLRDGDVVTILYTPRDGLMLSVNDRLYVQGRGHTVIEAILAAWAEDEPLTTKLRRMTEKHAC